MEPVRKYEGAVHIVMGAGEYLTDLKERLDRELLNDGTEPVPEEAVAELEQEVRSRGENREYLTARKEFEDEAKEMVEEGEKTAWRKKLKPRFFKIKNQGAPVQSPALPEIFTPVSQTARKFFGNCSCRGYTLRHRAGWERP